MSQHDTLPDQSWLQSYRAPGDYMDTYSVSIAGRKDLEGADMRVLADHILNAEIGWMKALLAMRDRVVSVLGMKTTQKLALDQVSKPMTEKEAGDRVGFFKIYKVADNEIILGEDDWHQDFRLSIFRSTGAAPRVFASTCCKRHNIAGYAYLALILPFHKKIARTVLAKALETKLAV